MQAEVPSCHRYHRHHRGARSNNQIRRSQPSFAGDCPQGERAGRTEERMWTKRLRRIHVTWAVPRSSAAGGCRGKPIPIPIPETEQAFGVPARGAGRGPGSL